MLSVQNILLDPGHERIAFFQDSQTGISSIVAIHTTALGPALGGCRMNAYSNLEEALVDVLRLSEGMSYKSALAGLRLGGGKAVIIADRALVEGRAQVFENFGRFVASLGGSYITAEDMGTSVNDMSYVQRTCEHVSGRDPKAGGGGDPSPWTALGTFSGMRACLERAFGSGDFRGRHIVIQGVGNVGKHLARLLREAGARLTIADRREDVAKRAAEEFSAEVCSVDQVFDCPADIFAPCAIGGILNRDTLPRIKARIVAGAANNQLATESIGAELQERGILYAPDFAINSGGVILCASEWEPGGYSESWVRERVERVYQTVGRVLDESKKTGEAPQHVAVRLAKERIAAAKSNVRPK